MSDIAQIGYDCDTSDGLATFLDLKTLKYLLQQGNIFAKESQMNETDAFKENRMFY